jgi:hypothetical protein
MIWALGNLPDNPRNATPPHRNAGESDAAYQERTKAIKATELDSCAYSDIWAPAARIIASQFPQPAGK